MLLLALQNIKGVKFVSEVQKNSSKSTASGCAGIVLLVILLIGGIFLLKGCIFGGSSKPTDITLNAELFRTDSEVEIVNKDSFVWENPEVTINDEYTFKTDFFAKGSSHIDLGRFTKDDGEKFDPSTHKPKKIMIYVPASESRPDGYFFADWKD